MTNQCQAINLRGYQCAKNAIINNLCVVHFEKHVRYKVEVVSS